MTKEEVFPKIREVETRVFKVFGKDKVYRELQYLDPVEGWMDVPKTYKYYGIFD